MIFLPLFGSAFASGWLVGLLRFKIGQDEEVGAVRSQASITGILTALVACFAAHAASNGGSFQLPLGLAAMFTGFGLLPSALLATIGAGVAHRIRYRRVASGGVSAGRGQMLALVASAALPTAAVLIWPAVYVAGKFLDKPPTTIPAPTLAVAPPLPKPRYVKPEGFDSANAWKRIVSHEDVIPNVDSQSPIELSSDERRLAFVTRENGVHQLAVRHLYDPGPDYSLPVDGGIAAMAWSPDDKRILFLSSERGELCVCVPDDSKVVRLPIPVLETGQRHGLVWWRDEHVVIYPSRGDPVILSLDSLRVATADEVPEWSKQTDSERARIAQEAFPPDMGRTAMAKFAFIGGTGDASRSLAINDDESLYTRLTASAERGFTSAFPNRDGTMFFVKEPERLRILNMGLRQAPPLRFIAEAKSAFPTHSAAKAALDERSVRAAVAAPIINPLNGKTVAGDPSHIKGFVRFISAKDRECTVWIEQEREPIREGDVLIRLSALRDGDEYSVATDWWAILKSADENQNIPRRDDVPSLLPSPDRVLLPLPEPAPPPPKVSAAPVSRPPEIPVTVASPIAVPMSPPSTSERPASVPKPQATVAAPPPKLTDEQKLRQFIIDHSASFSRGDIDAVANGYGAVIDLGPGKTMSRGEFADSLRQNRLGTTLFTETPIPPIEVKRLEGNRFALSYVARVEIHNPKKSGKLIELLLDLEVLVTSQGSKIVKQRESMLRSQTIEGKR